MKTAGRENPNHGYSARTFLAIVNTRCTPPLALNYDVLEADGNAYGVITIAPSPHVHYLTKDLDTPKGFWRKHSVLTRIGDEVQVASPQEIVKMEREKRRWGEALSSDVELLDVGLDTRDSPYVETKKDGVTWICREGGTGKWHKFPTFDFKLQNRGSATAFLHRLIVEVLEARLDISPVLSFRTEVDHQTLRVIASNNGWGPACDCEIQISEPTLDRLFSGTERRYKGDIEAGGKAIISLPSHPATQQRLHLLETEFEHVEVPKEKQWIYQGFGPETPSLGRRLRDIQVKWRHRDNTSQGQERHATAHLGLVFLTEEGYWEANSAEMSLACMAESDVVFVTGINFDPAKAPIEMEYAISRKVPPGDVERFHVIVGSRMSCFLTLKFKIVIDKSEIVTSEVFNIHLWNPRDWELHRWYSDGEALSRRRQQLQEELTHQRRGRHQLERFAQELEACERWQIIRCSLYVSLITSTTGFRIAPVRHAAYGLTSLFFQLMLLALAY